MTENIVQEQFADLFEKHNDEFLKFERIEDPLHSRPDICAFLLLHDLTFDATTFKPNKIVSGATREEIWLSIELSELSGKVTEDDIITLIRCGVRLEEEFDCLAMFV